MKKITLNQMEMVEGGVFWGTGQTKDCSLYNAGVSDDCLVCNQTYYFWIPAGSPTNCKWVSAAFA